MYGSESRKKGVDWFIGEELACAKAEARELLDKQYSAETSKQILEFSRDVGRQRDIVICKICQDDMERTGELRRCDDLSVDPWSWVVEDEKLRAQERWQQHFPAEPDLVRPKLGLPLHQIAPALAALTDFEEMVLALVLSLIHI